MPLMKCGSNGWKWGSTGHCYEDGSEGDNKRKAILQGVSYEGSTKVNKMLKKSKGWSDDDIKLAKEILNEGKGGWYSELTKNILAEFAKKSSENTTQVDQFGNKKKKNPPIDLPNDHSETSFTTMAGQVETMEDKQKNAEDLEGENEVKTKDTNAQQVFNLVEKQKQDEEDSINIKDPTT